MKKLLIRLVLILLASFFANWTLAQTVELPQSANDYYQSALQSYLTGDFDQAILWDSKALQVDPQDKKAGELLSLLISEKDTANKTVIWIGGKPTVVEQGAANAVPQAPVTLFKEKVVRSPSADSQRLAELETRVQTVAFLMERDSFSQYRELSGAQAQTTKRLDDISFGLRDLGLGMRVSNILFVLALAVACLALWKSWKNGLEIKKRPEDFSPASHAEERSRVVHIRRM